MSSNHMDQRPEKPGIEYKCFIQYFRQEQNPTRDDPFWQYFKSEREALDSGWENWRDDLGRKYKSMGLYCQDIWIRDLP
jgi:hypothetical protein